jgi:putative lipoprotein
MDTLTVTASYRERIALPPGAELDVHLLDLNAGAIPTRPIASQRFAMTSVPLAASLSYDPEVVRDGGRYGVIASIFSMQGQEIFRSDTPIEVPLSRTGTSVDLVLKMLPETEPRGASVTISGVSWTATEILGEPLRGNDRATMVIDADGNVALFGGCNRFMGQVRVSIGGLAFPESLAGTMMACPDDIEARERRFLDALKRVSGYVRYGSGLVLTDAKGQAVLHFEETPE